MSPISIYLFVYLFVYLFIYFAIHLQEGCKLNDDFALLECIEVQVNIEIIYIQFYILIIIIIISDIKRVHSHNLRSDLSMVWNVDEVDWPYDDDAQEKSQDA